VYVYRFNSETTQWFQEQKLVAPDGGHEDSLGFSVAIEGDRIVAGAIQTNNCQCLPPRTGSAHVFAFYSGSGSWALEAKLIPPDGLGGDLFGNAVSISGDRIVVGTMFAGYAYAFRHDNNGWVTEQKLEPSGGTGGGEFGSAIAIAGDRIVAGAPGVNSRRGAVFLFRFDPVKVTWVQEQILTDPNASENVGFGRSVAIGGELIVAGEPGSEAAYAFRFIADSDGDGVTDDRDQCPNSDVRPTIIIGTCDSGVENVLFEEEPAGCSITDEIMKLAADAKSHGQFVSQVDKFLQDLQSAGILEPNEKNAIKDCAVQSNLP
jgi:hypothetical protein